MDKTAERKHSSNRNGYRLPFWCFRVALLAAVLTTVSLPFHAQAAEPVPDKTLESVSLQLKWKHQFQFAGFYAALEKGFYRDAGLDVTLIEGGPGIDFIETVVSGRAEYGVEMPDLLLRRAEGAPVVVLACIYQHSPLVLMSLAESNIRTPHDLIGRTVMLRPASNADLRAMIHHDGIKLSAIKIIDHSFDMNDLIDGKADAMSLYSTNYVYEFKKLGVNVNILRPDSYGVDFYGDCLFTTEAEIEKHPDRVKAFRAASIKGWEYAMDNPQELAQLIHDKYAPGKSIEQLVAEAEQATPLLLHPVIEIGHINPGRWKHIADTFVSQGMLDKDYSLEGFIYDPHAGPDYHWLYTMTGLAAGIVFVGAVAKIWNKRLQIAVAQRTRELNESNRKNRELTENLPQRIFHKDASHVYVSCNRHYAEDLGIEPEQIAGKTDFDFYPKELAEKYRTDDRRLMESGQTEEIDEVYMKEGRELIIRTVKTPLTDDAGNVIGILGIFSDITERKQAEVELKQAKEFVDNAINAQVDTFFVFDPETGKAIKWNQQFSKISGYSDEEIASMKAPDSYYDGEDLDKADKGLRELAAAGSATVELSLIPKSGTKIPFEYKVSLIKTSDEKNIVISIGRDITERRQAEEALQKSETFTRMVMDNLPIGIAVNSVDPSVDFEYMNDKFPEYYRTTREALANPDSFWDAVYEDPEFREKIKKQVLDDCASNDPDRMYWQDVPITRKSDGTRFINARNTLVPDKQLMISSVWDVTDRKHAEAEREQFLKSLEFKNRELQDIVYTVSHDLRSPLVNIHGFSGELAKSCDEVTELLTEQDQETKERVESLLKEDIPQSLGFITRGTKKMGDLLDGLLQVSRVGSVEINIESIDMNELAGRVLANLEFQIKEKNIDVTVDALPNCFGDANMLDHIFSNLIGNAVKYSDPSRRCEIEISSRIEDGMSVYSVKDNGIGIEQDHQQKVFEIFHRLNPGDSAGGEGLGLTIVTRALDRLGGRIQLESQPGKGSCFSFALPTATTVPVQV